MRIEIWSDVVCPWCYIGKRRLETALSEYERAGEVEIVWRSFELDPDAPRSRSEPPAERLAQKYGMTVEQARESQARVTAIAAAEGLEYRLADARSGNSFDAHRLLHLAGGHGLQHELKERLLRAYFTEGEAIGEPDVLERLGIEVGLDGAEVAALLAGDRFADDVRADERRARLLGIRGVPFFVVDERVGVEGAQPAGVILGALRQADAGAAA